MPQKSKKSKKKDAGTRKQEANVTAQTKYSEKPSTSKGADLKFTYFNNDELQELKNILKCKDPSSVPLALTCVVLYKVDKLKKLLQKGININDPGPNNMTALMWAIKIKSLELIDLLLANGADPTIKNENGDSVMHSAIENKLWDQKSYLSLWNRIKSVSFIDVNSISKTGYSIIHTCIRRDWNEVVNKLIMEKANINAESSNGMTPLMLACHLNNVYMVTALLHANADVLKKDTTGCIALCYAISYVMNKNVQLPHLVVDKILTALNTKQVSLKDFLKSQIDLILNNAVEQNKTGQPVSDIKMSILPYALRYKDETLKILLEINIFKKISLAGQKYDQEPFQILKLLTLINDILKHCDQNVGPVEKQLFKSFISCGVADMCLGVFKRHGNEINYNHDFISSAFIPLLTICTLDSNARLWLNKNYFNLIPYYMKFLIIHSENAPKNSQTEKINKQLAKFKNIIEDIKKKWSYPECEIDKSQQHSEENLKITKDKQQQKPLSKKSKLRTKVLKVQIEKVKSADLTQRGKRIQEVKCLSDTSIINSVNTKNIENDKTDATSGNWSQSTSWQHVWLLDDKSRPPVQSLNQTINKLGNHLGIDVENSLLNMDLTTVINIKKENSQPKYENVSLYPDWKNKSLSVPNIAKDTSNNRETEQTWAKMFLPGTSNTGEKEKRTSEQIQPTVDQTLNYLSGLIKTITDTYQRIWEQDKQLEKEAGNTSETLDDIRSMKKLEKEYIELTQSQFDNLTKCIKSNIHTHFIDCNKSINILEGLLLNHKIRGRPVIFDTPVKFVNSDNNVDNCKISNAPSKPKSIKDLINQIKSDNDAVKNLLGFYFPSGQSINCNKNQLDMSYIHDTLALPERTPLSEDKLRSIKIQTMASAYHLTQSIVDMCDDNDESLIKNTLLAMPGSSNSDRMLNVVENCDNYTHLGTTTSRWCIAVRNLQISNNYHTLLNGDIRIGVKAKDEFSHTIFSGGNFSTVVLGLDLWNQPLAVKRIKKNNSECKKIKSLLNPLLGLRNANLLHYYTCNYQDNELVLATPLCEYNIGEYVSLIRQSPGLHLKPIEAVKQFLAGLRFLHYRSEPIVHGNLKPSNIFIDLKGTVRIAEFGMYKALYTSTKVANTSVIWFSRETFSTFKETARVICTCASDIHVAGMLIHFILTVGKHPYGETMQDILKNLEQAIPKLITTDIDLNDLISWMLLYEPNERPTIDQVLSHVFFWNTDKRWRFILSCAGTSSHGTRLKIKLFDLHFYIDKVARRKNIRGRWITATKRIFPNLVYSKHEKDSITGLLKFIRNNMQNQISFQLKLDYKFRNFILSSFPALPLSLYRILESSQWLTHHVLQPFTTVDSLSA